MRVLSYDTSMSAPGVALLEVKKDKAFIIAVSHMRTSAKDSHALRHEIIDAWSTLFIDRHVSKGFDVIVREDFQGRSSKQNFPVFSAWAAVDSSLNKFGLNFTTPAISQSKVKKLVVGKGKAEKHEVEEAVRKWTGYTGEFAKDDESDAVAIGLAYLIEEGLIDGKV